MSQNLPLSDDIFAEPAENAQIDESNLRIARAGKSDDWQDIRAYMLNRIKQYDESLLGENLNGVPNAVIGERFLISRSVAAEFEQLISMVDNITKSITGDGEE